MDIMIHYHGDYSIITMMITVSLPFLSGQEVLQYGFEVVKNYVQ